jgi:hypothetical protein
MVLVKRNQISKPYLMFSQLSNVYNKFSNCKVIENDKILYFQFKKMIIVNELKTFNEIFSKNIISSFPINFSFFSALVGFPVCC